ncbi:Ig-like domain-containing protein [Myxococcota bacterium]
MVAMVAACDPGVGREHERLGPSLHLVASSPADGEGLECLPGGSADCGVVRSSPIELRFDRFLLPATAVRQSITFYTGVEDEYVWVEPHYDLIERVVRYALGPGQALRPAVRYTVRIVRTDQNEPGYGFRAFDGSALAASGSAPLSFSFRTQDQSASPMPVEPPPSCSEVMAVFRRGGCSHCHQSERTPDCSPGDISAMGPTCSGTTGMDLDLSSAAAVRSTANSRVARQTDQEATSGIALRNPERFGTAMPLIDPGRPENSYLLYKLLAHRGSYGPAPCRNSTHRVDLGSHCVAATPEETQRLRDWFVRGDPMPPGPNSPLQANDLRAVQHWIASGAGTNRCDQ